MFLMSRSRVMIGVYSLRSANIRTKMHHIKDHYRSERHHNSHDRIGGYRHFSSRNRILLSPRAWGARRCLFAHRWQACMCVAVLPHSIDDSRARRIATRTIQVDPGLWLVSAAHGLSLPRHARLTSSTWICTESWLSKCQLRTHSPYSTGTLPLSASVRPLCMECMIHSSALQWP